MNDIAPKNTEKMMNLYKDILNRRDAEREKPDAHILKFSAGIFGISFAFINQIVSVDLVDSKCVGLLLSSWIIFAVVISLSLFNYYLSEKVLTKLLSSFAKELKKDKIDINNLKIDSKVNTVNFITMALFFIGIGLLLSYVIINTGGFVGNV